MKKLVTPYLIIVFVVYVAWFATFKDVIFNERLFFSSETVQTYSGPYALEKIFLGIDDDSIPPGHSFLRVWRSFGNIDLSKTHRISKDELEKLILDSLPHSLRERLIPYLSMTLRISEKYQVDPFWVLAVMWTEGHFNPGARSSAGARGLMQILPRTGRYLLKLLGKPTEDYALHSLLYDPELNIEMGIVYLKSLHRRFGSYRLATIAYNMGPDRVRLRLKNKLPVGEKNRYFSKVERAYEHLTRNYGKKLPTFRDSPKEYTYVMSPRKMTIDEEIHAVFTFSYMGLPVALAMGDYTPRLLLSSAAFSSL